MAEAYSTRKDPPSGADEALRPDGGLDAGSTIRESAQRQLELMCSTQSSAVQRVSAGNELARLGDPRFRPNGWYLPDESLLGFVEIPAGPFFIGSDPAQD